MHINWLGFNWRDSDGYGRYSARMVQALERAGVTVDAYPSAAADAPKWLLARWGVDLSLPTISCLPPFYLSRAKSVHGPHWLLTMTEGTECPPGWAEIINKAGIDRLIVPCEHNAVAFRRGGVACPVSVIPGGTDPDEFPLLRGQRPERPYTFLALADRGKRKGLDEAYRAFYKAFGGKTTGVQDVRLMIKCLPGGNDVITEYVMHAIDMDKRLIFNTEIVEDMNDLYAQVDCFVIPSRSEGWGMPHREAAMAGLPVITQAHAGLDDGHTHEWAIVVEKGHMQPIEDMGKHLAGQWRVADIDELAAKMRQCYENPWQTHKHASFAREWLKNNQTWDHAAVKLLTLMVDEGMVQDDPPQRELATIRAANARYMADLEAMTWPT